MKRQPPLILHQGYKNEIVDTQISSFMGSPTEEERENTGFKKKRKKIEQLRKKMANTKRGALFETSKKISWS